MKKQLICFERYFILAITLNMLLKTNSLIVTGLTQSYPALSNYIIQVHVHVSNKLIKVQCSHKVRVCSATERLNPSSNKRSVEPLCYGFIRKSELELFSPCAMYIILNRYSHAASELSLLIFQFHYNYDVVFKLSIFWNKRFLI